MGISGPGPFQGVRLPEEGENPKSELQEKLVNLNSSKQAILKELISGNNTSIHDDDLTLIWNQVLTCVGDYLGQLQNGLPPTASEMSSAIETICRIADKLDDAVGDLNFHVEDTLHKAMHRQGGDLYKLKKQLSKLIDADIIAKGMHDKRRYPVDLMRYPKNGEQTVSRAYGPKGYPDPYLKQLIEHLHDIWSDANGKPPGKTGTDNYKGGRTSPFYRWCTVMTKVLDMPSFPRDLIDTVIDLKRTDG